MKHLLQVLKGNVTVFLIFEDFIHIYTVVIIIIFDLITFCFTPPTPAYIYN